MAQDEDTEQRIRERAFHLWIEDGQPSDKADEHWEKARAEIEGPKDGPEEKAATPPNGTVFGP